MNNQSVLSGECNYPSCDNGASNKYLNQLDNRIKFSHDA